MKKTIAIVAGGDSSEHDVSLRSAEGIHSFLDKERYEVYIIEIKGMTWEAHLKDGSRSNVDRNDFSFMEGGKRIRPDFAYITIHGTPGENGILQGYFDLMTFNKFTLNQYLKGFGVSVSESLIVRKGFEHLVTDDEIIEKIGLPCFVKPNAGGSSFGVTKVKSADQIHEAILKAMRESDEVMVEAFMEGTEISQGCYKTQEKEVVLPATEVVSDNEFFDYNAKYNA